MKWKLWMVVGLLAIVHLSFACKDHPGGCDDSDSSPIHSSKKKRHHSSSSEDSDESSSDSGKPKNKCVGPHNGPANTTCVARKCLLEFKDFNLDVNEVLKLLIPCDTAKTNGKPDFEKNLATNVHIAYLCVAVYSDDINCKGLNITLFELLNCNTVARIKLEKENNLCILSKLVVILEGVDVQALDKDCRGNPTLLPVKKLIDDVVSGGCPKKGKPKQLVPISGVPI